MKRVLLVLVAIATFSLTANSQSYSEDFEGYAAGDYMGIVNPDFWTTWSGAVGGAEDVQVTDAISSSGANAIYFQSTSSGGGPQDVVLELGGEYNSGRMNVSMMMYVEAGKGGYFNFQGNETIGQVWAMEVFFNQLGELNIVESGNVVAKGNFNHNEWLQLDFSLNFTVNNWEVFLNGNSLGCSGNSTNQVASIDFFPFNANLGGNNQSGYYIDDFSFEYFPYTPLDLDGALANLQVATVGVTGQQRSVSGSFMNVGNNNVNSFDLSWTYGSDSGNESFTGLNIGNLDTYDFTFNNDITLLEGINPFTIEISNVNGGADDDPTNQVCVQSVQAVTAAENKIVVGEEATGTWCGWCVRGFIFLEYMHDFYDDYFAAIAVHNGDPMAISEYDDGLNASGFPNMKVDRGGWLDPSLVEQGFIDRITAPADATFTNGAQYNSATGELDISVQVNAVNDLSDNFRLAVALIENEVTGTGNGWEQANYYSGGSNGPMGGYEDLPAIVPASQMIYNEVARAILGTFNGVPVQALSSGSLETFNFSYTIPADQEFENMKMIPILINPDGSVNNGGVATLEEAVANGFVVGIEDLNSQNLEYAVYPNPVQDVSFISINLEESAMVSLRVIDALGKTVIENELGNLRGELVLPVDFSGMENGVYFIMTQVGDEQLTKKVVLTR